MGLRDAVLAGGISRLALLRHYLTLAGQTALKLRTHFVSGSFFERIGTTVEHPHGADRD
jgi:hypothetical protein